MTIIRSSSILGIGAILVAILAAATDVHAQGRRYNTSGDFQSGLLISLNDGGDKLLMQDEGTPLPFLYIPADGGTILRLDAETGDILGEYPSAPDNMVANPKRIAVDQLGNAWVLNWGETDDTCTGRTNASLVRVGVVIGGTRTDANGNPDANGEYLKPPFIYNTCLDRDGDGLIRTSRGGGNVLAWPNAGSEDTCGGISTCQDETILDFIRVDPTDEPGVLTIDSDNDVWVGGRGDFFARGVPPSIHQKISGILGIPIPGQTFEDFCGRSDAVVTKNGRLWSVSTELDTGLLTFDPGDEEPSCGTLFRSDSIAIDPTNGTLWYVDADQPRLVQLDQDGNELSTLDLGGFGVELGIDSFGNLWVSAIVGGVRKVQRWIPDPNNPGEYLLIWEFDNEATMMSIDTNGKIWIANRVVEEIIRIDPTAGPTPFAGLPPRGDIDLQLGLPQNATVGGFGDATGFSVLANAVDEGSWVVTHDSEQDGTPWGTVNWEAIIPKGTSLEVCVRASDDVLRLADEPYLVVQNGVSFNNLSGRYAEMKVRFIRTDEALGESPVLESIEIEPAECHLLVAEGSGDDTYAFGSNSHVFSTRLENIYKAYPVLMESIPTMTLHLPKPDAFTAPSSTVGVSGGIKPARTFYVQVVMHNPRVFPGNPEQSTPGMKVNVWPDGTVTTHKYGEADGNMDLEIEVLSVEDGIIELTVPFVVGPS